jgi:hypothetical protein
MKHGVRVLALVGLLCMPATARAQRSASIYLAPEHWAHEALRELNLRGLAGNNVFDGGSRSATVLRALRAFDAAADSAGDTPAGQRAAGYAALLRAESGERETAATSHAAGVGGEYEAHDGRVAPGDGYEPADREGAQPLPDVSEVRAVLSLQARAGAVAGGASVYAGTQHSGVRELQAVVRVRDLQMWVGRKASAYGNSTDGLLLSDNVSFDGGGVALANPVRARSPFKGQGRVNIEGFVSRLDEVGVVEKPWFFAGRFSYSPHARFTVGINRGAIFGGEGNAAVTGERLLRMLIGLYSGRAGGFENQIVSADMRYRLPLGTAAPLVFLEWASEDGSGSFLKVPARRGGITMPFNVGSQAVDLTLERTHIDHQCCGNPIWYRHGQFQGSWAQDGKPIATVLGGHGSETALTVRAVSGGAGVRAQLRGFVRTRAEENIYAPEREGGSAGANAKLTVRLTRALEAHAAGWYEAGDDWSERRVQVGAQWHLTGR